MPSIIRSILALAASVAAVHTLYVTVIWPRAAEALLAAEQQGLSAPRTFAVILKDYEQEACLILMCWGVYLILEKCYAIAKHRYLFGMQLVEFGADAAREKDADDARGTVAVVEPESDAGDSDATRASRKFTLREMRAALREFDGIEDAEMRNTPLIKTLHGAARRYIATEDVQNTSDAIVTGVDALAARIESGNSMIRYLIWAIPSIGFIGTVRGIGQALSQADQALAGDIAGMTNSLGIAFNSTLVALVISILLMFLLHELQRMQDKLVVDTQAYCEEFLLNRIEKN